MFLKERLGNKQHERQVKKIEGKGIARGGY
jgi:hypothetical protein